MSEGDEPQAQVILEDQLQLSATPNPWKTQHNSRLTDNIPKSE